MEDHRDTNSAADAELEKDALDLSHLSSSHQKVLTQDSTRCISAIDPVSEVKFDRAESETEFGQDGYGADDYFSRLNDLCILEVFKHLTRKEIHKMSTVNSRMYPFANERSLDFIKSDGGVLSIWKIDNGYAFTLEGDDEENGYKYSITRNEDGNFNEEKKVYGNTNAKRTKTLPDTKPITDYLFDTLSQFLRQRGVFCLWIDEISIETVFMTKLEQVLTGHSTEMLKYDPVNDESGPNDGRIILTRIMKKMNEVCMSSGQNVIDENFIRAIAGGKLKHFSSAGELHPLNGARNGDEPNEKLAHFFVPDRSILPLLVGFDVLKIPTLRLKHTWIASLAMVCIEFYGKKRSEAWMQFSIDQVITTEIITSIIRNDEYEYMFEQGNHYILRRRDRMRVRISTLDYTVEGQIVHGLAIHVFHEETHEE